MRGTLEERFWHYVDMTPGQGPKGDCWRWTGGCVRRGYSYGTLNAGDPSKNNRALRAHVVSWQLHNPGIQIPAKWHIRHLCHWKMCVKPAHLELGTAKQNQRDGIRKRESERKSKPVAVREYGRWANLNSRQRALLRVARVGKGLKQREIAQMLGIDVTHLCRVERGGRWLRVEHLHFLLRFLRVERHLFEPAECVVEEFGLPLRVAA